MFAAFEQIDHTADLAIRACGRELAELFQNAARGMFSLIAETHGLRPDTERTVEVTAEDRESLLVAWLRKLLFFFETELIVFTDFRVESVSDQHLHARVYGAHLSEDDERIYGEIKAVTYHGLRITETSEALCAEVVFDT